MISREMTAVKTFNAGMHLDDYKLVKFKLGMIIDTNVLCTLVLV